MSIDDEELKKNRTFPAVQDMWKKPGHDRD